jgi:hypothetical protein
VSGCAAEELASPLERPIDLPVISRFSRIDVRSLKQRSWQLPLQERVERWCVEHWGGEC